MKEQLWEWIGDGKYRIWKWVVMPIHFIHDLREDSETVIVTIDWKQYKQIKVNIEG